MDCAPEIVAQVLAAAAAGAPLAIAGGGTRAALGAPTRGTALGLGRHSGILDYEPRELVITARAGTPIAVIEAALESRGQMLAFEPPRFGAASTLGGVVASGLSGPRRAYAGAARDFVLGCRVVNGRGEDLRFGGQVMKNVAGYDVSRLMAGAFGTLGVLLELSLKVLPRPATSLTVASECSAEFALRRMRELAARPWPLDASCHVDGRLFLRLSGSEPAVAHARRRLGGELLEDDAAFWRGLRDQALPFFDGPAPLWRLGVSATAPLSGLEGVIEWGGAQRWIRGEADREGMRTLAARHGGHATLYRGGAQTFQPLPAPLLALHRSLKRAFDPAGILNPGRLYPEF